MLGWRADCACMHFCMLAVDRHEERGHLGGMNSSAAKEGKTAVRKRRPALPGKSPLGLSGSRPFSVKQFCSRYKLVRRDLTRLTGYSQRAVDKWAAGGEPGGAASKHLRELARLFDAMANLVEPASIGPWLKRPNTAFDGSTPLQVIERGESDRLWRMIYELESGEPA